MPGREEGVFKVRLAAKLCCVEMGGVAEGGLEEPGASTEGGVDKPGVFGYFGAMKPGCSGECRAFTVQAPDPALGQVQVDKRGACEVEIDVSPG
ncbi:hypothetical protein [Amycolatopsis samaneae]|uniref:Uncharacterized protein n=1 Tax=Amycolatopsis samaneae TaxID=664691 RepID=A0ABW5GKE8_9PSEU